MYKHSITSKILTDIACDNHIVDFFNNNMPCILNFKYVEIKGDYLGYFRFLKGVASTIDLNKFLYNRKIYEYDLSGNLCRIIFYDGNELNIRNEYDVQGRIKKILYPYGSIKEYIYNDDGTYIIKEKRPYKLSKYQNKSYSEFIYYYKVNNKLNYVILPNGSIEYYDNKGNVIERKFLNGAIFNYKYEYTEKGYLSKFPGGSIIYYC